MRSEEELREALERLEDDPMVEMPNRYRSKHHGKKLGIKYALGEADEL